MLYQLSHPQFRRCNVQTSDDLYFNHRYPEKRSFRTAPSSLMAFLPGCVSMLVIHSHPHKCPELQLRVLFSIHSSYFENSIWNSLLTIFVWPVNISSFLKFQNTNEANTQHLLHLPNKTEKGSTTENQLEKATSFPYSAPPLLITAHFKTIYA